MLFRRLIYIDICSLTRFQFLVVVAGMDNQLKKVSLPSRSLHLRHAAPVM